MEELQMEADCMVMFRVELRPAAGVRNRSAGEGCMHYLAAAERMHWLQRMTVAVRLAWDLTGGSSSVEVRPEAVLWEVEVGLASIQAGTLAMCLVDKGPAVVPRDPADSGKES